jgi:hypothetical protein
MRRSQLRVISPKFLLVPLLLAVVLLLRTSGEAKTAMSPGGTIETAGQPCDSNYVDPNASGGFDVTPRDTVPADVNNVQCALDNTAAGGTVLLKDDVPFNFGDSAVRITTPNVVLKGETDGIGTDQFPSGTPTTKIANIGEVGGCLGIQVRAPGTKILSLELDGTKRYFINLLNGQSGNAIEIKGNQMTNGTFAFGIINYCDGFVSNVSPIEIENNRIDFATSGYGIRLSDLSGDVNIEENSFETAIGLYLNAMTGNVNVEDNVISASWGGIYVLDYDGTLDIKKNSLSQIGVDGIFIGSWWAGAETGGVDGDPEDGENGRTRVIGNSIGLVDRGTGALGILVGSSAQGINRAMVKDNRLWGESDYVGIAKGPYGHNNFIMDNDLTGLSVHGAQIFQAGGRDNKFLNNKLGPVVGPWGFGPGGGVDDYVPAVLSFTVNWHEADGGNTPDPVNEGNMFSNNDYTGTVSGFLKSEDPKLIILDFMQKFDENGSPYQLYYPDDFAGATNIVSESNFPEGRKVCTQVRDLTNLNPDEPDLAEGTSHVAGWTACEARARKAAFEAASEAYKNFGQFLKARTLEPRKESELVEEDIES